MGLTVQSTGSSVLRAQFRPSGGRHIVIALAGNPNTGKSTIFNNLTGLKQHTGNWPGKTVTTAEGFFTYRGKAFKVVDLPGTYSLLANSVEEQVARDFICFARPTATVVVADSTCLERNLNLILQVLEITGRVVVCLNLIDEAERKNIRINVKGLERELGVPVVSTAARDGTGIEALKDAVYEIAVKMKPTDPRKVEYDGEIRDAAGVIVPEKQRNLPD